MLNISRLRSAKASQNPSSRIFGSLIGAASLLALLGNATPAHAGYWGITLKAAGQNSWSNTVSPAWLALENVGDGNPKKGASPWKEQTTGTYDTAQFSTGALAGVGPTEAALHYGGLGGPGVPPEPFSTSVESSGSVTAVLSWHAENENDLPPTAVHIVEETTAITSRDSNWLPTQTGEVGLPNGTEETITGFGNVDITKTARRSKVLDNPTRKTQITVPTCDLKAASAGNGDGLDQRPHGHGVSVSYKISASPVTGNIRLISAREDSQGVLRTLNQPNSPETPKTVGGRIWVGAEFRIDRNFRLDPAVKALTLRILEDEDASLPADDRHTHEKDDCIDVKLPLTPNGPLPDVKTVPQVAPAATPAPGEPPVPVGATKRIKWQKMIGYYPFGGHDEEWQDTTEPFSTPNTEIINVMYRVLWTWDTFETLSAGDKKLYDHNGPHTLSLERVEGSKTVDFVPYLNGTSLGKGGLRVEKEKINKPALDVKNLVLEDVGAVYAGYPNGNPDYFFFDADESAPEWMQKPTIKFTIKDESATPQDSYKWRIRVRPTSDELKYKEAVFEGQTDSPKRLTIPLLEFEGLSSGESSLSITSAYNFEIKVWKSFSEGYEDRGVTYRSIYNYIPDFYGNAETPGHDTKIVEGTNGFDVIQNYIVRNIKDSRPLNQLKSKSIYLKDGQEFASLDGLPKSCNEMHSNVVIAQIQSLTSEYDSFSSILLGEDRFASLYREHKNRRILPKNGINQPYRFNMWYEGVSGGAGNAATTWSNGASQIGLDNLGEDYAKNYIRNEMVKYGLHTFWHSLFATNHTIGATPVSGAGVGALNDEQKDKNFDLNYATNTVTGKNSRRANSSKKVMIVRFIDSSMGDRFSHLGHYGPVTGPSNNAAPGVISLNIASLKIAGLPQDTPQNTSPDNPNSFQGMIDKEWENLRTNPKNQSSPFMYRYRKNARGNGDFIQIEKLDPSNTTTATPIAGEGILSVWKPAQASYIAQFYANTLMHEMWHGGSAQGGAAHCAEDLYDCLCTDIAGPAFMGQLASRFNGGTRGPVEFREAAYKRLDGNIEPRWVSRFSVLHDGGTRGVYPIGKKGEIGMLQQGMNYWVRNGHEGTK